MQTPEINCGVAQSSGKRPHRLGRRSSSTNHHSPRRTIQDAIRGIEALDDMLLVFTAAMFIAGALALLVYSVFSAVEGFAKGVPTAVAPLIKDLLVVMVMMEIAATITTYVKAKPSGDKRHASRGTLFLRSMLLIGIASAVRELLASGAEAAMGGHVSRAAQSAQFQATLLSAIVILVLTAAVHMVGSSERAPITSERR